ncbi:MAG: type IV-A pilus assembly ATPase PilB [Gammaproteobacteria bacterium]|nr:type IV-A pilus assembly ATPase PilB [Gammaproteobacteria bacterium]
MATPHIATNLSGLALRLVRDKLLSPAEAERLQGEAQVKKTPFVTQLVDSKKLDSGTIARVASSEFGLPLFEVGALDLDQAPIKLVDEKIIRRHRVLPLFKRGTKLFVAISDPTNLQALDEIKFHTGLGAEPILVEEGRLGALLDKALEAADQTLIQLTTGDDFEGLDIISDDDAPAGADGGEAGVDDAPIVRFVNKLMMDAINRGASDIHIEPYEKTYRVRYRQDGMLHEVASPPLTLAGRIAARIKILSRLDIAERRVPQDGRMKLRVSKNRAIDFRVSTLPTLYGEKLVMRILDSAGATLGLDSLGFEAEQKRLFTEAINRPYGMVLATGPTGSGKTVTLYTGLNMLNSIDRNISTAEDPVEINVAGINQVNINERAGLTFASAMRAFLRQDPDVIMVGEIRDLETAEIAVKAAQTGHMVLSTLHTNDAPTTLSRLANMGVAPFNIASAVSLIVAQRLARRLCPTCKKPVKIPEPALLKAGYKESEVHDLKLFGPVGCDACSNGYRGRVGIYQVLPVTEEIGAIIMRGGNALDIEHQARKEGFPDLRASALKKVRDGVTSLEEIERVTNQ